MRVPLAESAAHYAEAAQYVLIMACAREGTAALFIFTTPSPLPRMAPRYRCARKEALSMGSFFFLPSLPFAYIDIAISLRLRYALIHSAY